MRGCFKAFSHLQWRIGLKFWQSVLHLFDYIIERRIQLGLLVMLYFVDF